MSTDSRKVLGYVFDVVISLAIGINLGVKVTDDLMADKKRVCASVQNDQMETWLHATCFLDDTYIYSFDGEGHTLWLQGMSIPLTADEARTIHALLGCKHDDDGSDA